MDLTTARRIVEALADGIDPATGEVLAPGSPLESADVIGALNLSLDALDYQIRKREREAESPLNAGKPWYPDDDRDLAEAFDAGETVAAIARRMARTEGSIASRLVRIGKVRDRDEARAANRSRT